MSKACFCTAWVHDKGEKQRATRFLQVDWEMANEYSIFRLHPRPRISSPANWHDASSVTIHRLQSDRAAATS